MAKAKKKSSKNKKPVVRHRGRQVKKVKKRAYLLPAPREVTVAKLDAQLKRLKERKLVPKRATSLLGVTLVREYHGKKFVVRATKKGWLNKASGKVYSGLFGVACAIVGAPRNPYVFFKAAFKDAEIN